MSRTGGIDFFDVDHTVLRGTSGLRFLLMGVRWRVFPLRAALYIPFLLLQYRLGRVHGDFSDRVFGSLRGRRHADLARLARESYARVRRRIYPQARKLIAERKAAGRRVVFATSSIDIIVRPMAEELGVEEVLAVSLEIEGDRCTGRFHGPPLFGRKKMQEVLRYMAREGFRPEECAFFSDSVTDLPLLLEVGEPVAVNPDPRLYKLARRRGWCVLWFRAARRGPRGRAAGRSASSSP